MAKKVSALQTYWQEPSLWSHAVIADDFSALTFPIEGEDTALLETAVQQKLAQAGLILSDLPKLMPFFLRGGWPLEQERQAGAVTVSLRLGEPEEDSDVWLLETVLSTPTAKTTGRQLCESSHYQLLMLYRQNGKCMLMLLNNNKDKL